MKIENDVALEVAQLQMSFIDSLIDVSVKYSFSLETLLDMANNSFREMEGHE